jgi:plasmid stabilization system protein ParE
MTPEDIQEIAEIIAHKGAMTWFRKAGNFNTYEAAQAAKDIAAAIQSAVEKEREECAKIAMSYRTPDDGDYACGKDVVARDIAEEIRGRK